MTSPSEASSFELLLAALGPDRDAAGDNYEAVRQRLIRVFRLWGSDAPEDAADVTISRVSAKIAAGERIRAEDPYAYFHGVARFVFQEQLRTRRKERAAVAEHPGSASADDDREYRAAQLDHCLSELDPELRSAILEYYDLERRARIDRRRALAARLGLAGPALRLRMQRTRDRIRECMSRKP